MRPKTSGDRIMSSNPDKLRIKAISNPSENLKYTDRQTFSDPVKTLR